MRVSLSSSPQIEPIRGEMIGAMGADNLALRLTHRLTVKAADGTWWPRTPAVGDFCAVIELKEWKVKEYRHRRPFPCSRRWDRRDTWRRSHDDMRRREMFWIECWVAKDDIDAALPILDSQMKTPIVEYPLALSFYGVSGNRPLFLAIC
jgi:hypothetical protein